MSNVVECSCKYCLRTRIVNLESENEEFRETIDGLESELSHAKREVEQPLRARIEELEGLLCRVSNELHDPAGERWCDEPNEDRILLGNLKGVVDKCVDRILDTPKRVEK